MKRPFFLAVPLLIILTVSAFGQDTKTAGGQNFSSPAVDSVLNNYLRACGGSALAEIKNETIKGTFMRGSSGRVPLEIISQSPGKWRYNQIFAWGDQVTFGCDGVSAWIQDTSGIRDMPPRQTLDLKALFDPQFPLKIRDIYPKMHPLKTDSIDSKEVTTIVGETPDGMSTELSFEKGTGYLIQAGEIGLQDYRQVGQVYRPFKIILRNDPGEEKYPMIMQFADIKHNQEIAGSSFDTPSCPLPLVASPINKPRKQVAVSAAALDACAGTYRDQKDTTIVLSVVRQGTHLMMGRAGLGTKIEIKPESELDYFIGFLNAEYHFVKDSTGKVTSIEIGAQRTRRAIRIN